MPELPEVEITARRIGSAVAGATVESAPAPWIKVLKTHDPPPLDELLDAPRPLHGLLRDQRVIAGIGRSWADEILHAARLSPFKRGSDLGAAEAEALRAAIAEVLDGAIEHYERTVELPIP